MMEGTLKHHEKLTPWKIVILCLSLYVLAALIYNMTGNPSERVSKVIHFTDTAICLLFLADFFVNLSRAESKLAYLKWGWVDLVSSIPVVNAARWGRLIRVILIIRLFRGFRSYRRLLDHLMENKAKSVFALATLAAVTVLFWATIAVMHFENSPASNIQTAEDAIWWAFSTITGVGYGDKYPVTTQGRLVGLVLMTAGVGLFLTFTGSIASWLIGVEKREEAAVRQLQEDLKEIKEKLSEMEDLIGKGGRKG